MFLEPDEHLIVMEDELYKPFDLSDLDALQEAGVRTILLPHAAGQDHILFRHHNMFKVLIPFYYSQESFVDLVRDRERVLTYAQSAIYRVPSSVQLIYGLPGGGEFLWDAMLTKDFPLSDDEIIDFVISVQRILVSQYGEVWLSLHNFMGHPDNWNHTHLPVLYQALRDEFPDFPIYSFQFIHFSCGGTPTMLEDQQMITKYAEQYGIRFFVGPDYCEGLIRNFRAAVEQKAYGFVVAPLHTENEYKHTEIKPWMVSALRGAQDEFRGLYGKH